MFEMGKHLPLKITFLDGHSMLVSSLCDAEKALAGEWRSKEADVYKNAERLIAAAKEGVCKPEVAFDAFKKAARRQRLLHPTKRSSALRMLDNLAAPLFKQDLP
ncbi:DUF982 domain-containing protein [Mesorhizobium sp. M00.F.Ca.ET.216.01.1.1]|uniref:DUF982 domain-containing protein n=1 Tax=Mesorhizobium sp. M00.F.Ca.ET.216.01.1.1 TaxID=2500528 RepID=UPI0026A0C7AB